MKTKQNWLYLGFGLSLVVLFYVVMVGSGGSSEVVEYPQATDSSVIKQGDPAMRGGTATVRKPFEKKPDDPTTTNDESNDQPLGHFGTTTLRVRNVNSGNTYLLDADVDNFEDEYYLRRLYFVKGGWVDFVRCDLDTDGTGFCTDENGTSWDITPD